MPSSVPSARIRGAQPDDADALVGLQTSIYHEDLWFVGDGPPSAERLRRRLRGLETEMELYLVAGHWANGQPPRLYAWLELNRFFTAKMKHVAMLTLAVSRERRRQGLGRRLLACACDWAEEVGVEKVQLNVRASNAAAVALYQAEGFVLEGRERRQIKTSSGYDDNLLMSRFLQEGPRSG